MCKSQPKLKFETLIRRTELVVNENDFQLCGTAEKTTESPRCLGSNGTLLSCSCMPAVSLRDLFWQDVFLEIAVALISLGVTCEKWITVHMRCVWRQCEEKDQLRNFPRTSAQALLHSLELCKQSCRNYYHLQIRWRNWKKPESKRKVVGDFSKFCHWEQYLIPVLLQGHWYPQIISPRAPQEKGGGPWIVLLQCVNKHTSLASPFSS